MRGNSIVIGEKLVKDSGDWTVSEYQYYEFQAVDRPLDESDREELRALSSRARITASRFADGYEWGDFKGNPQGLMTRWFDLHLHVANWGRRRLMIRLPERLVDRSRLDRFLRGVEIVNVLESGEHLVVDIRDDLEDAETEYDDLEDCAVKLAALAPLRGDLLGGDWRAFYLLWLIAAERGWLGDEVVEPLPGIGLLNGGLEALVGLFRIDRDFVQAAAERPMLPVEPTVADAIRRVVAAIPEAEKAALLCRMLDNEPHVAEEVRNRLSLAVSSVTGDSLVRRRSVAELRARALAIRTSRESSQAKRLASERCHRARQAQRQRQERLEVVRRRGVLSWREVEREINHCNAAAYDRAVDLLLDLKTVAEEGGTVEAFMDRIRALRARHAGKTLFLERLWELNVS